MSRTPIDRRLPPPSRVSRVAACLLGGALGDAIGELAQHDLDRFRGMSPADLAVREERLVWTDDTAMAISVAECLVARGRVDGEWLGARFHLSWHREPWRGYASGPPTIFALVEKDSMGYAEAARRVNEALFGAEGSCGNGAAMRAAPIGLLPLGWAELSAAAEAQACLTHLHPAGIEGSRLQTLAVSLALASDPRSPLKASGFAELLAAEARTDEFRSRFKDLQALLQEGAQDAVAAEALGRGETAQDSWPFALWSFLAHPDSFEDCLACACAHARDADTVAAMACAISGARLGLEDLPFPWLARLEARERIASLARLLSLAAEGIRACDDNDGAELLALWEGEREALLAGEDLDPATAASQPARPSVSRPVLESDYFRRHVGHLAGDPEPDWSSLTPVEVKVVEDNGTVEDLVPARHLEITEAREAMRAAMESRSAWFHENGEEVLEPKWLALGKKEGLVAFSERLSPRLGTELLVPHFLVSLSLQRPGPSMLFFIETALRLDLDLSGFSLGELRAATSGKGGLASGFRDYGISGMPAWCLNRVYWSPALDKAWWHCPPGMSREAVLEVLGDSVNPARVLAD